MGLKKQIGKFKKGSKNSITDVKGVKVGHTTLTGDGKETGVTAIIPKENMFEEKLLAASHVINGFAKPQGLIQIDELGTLESPIVLTNTLSVGTALTALIKHMLKENPGIGVETGTINCPILECNDMKLNDIRSLFVKEEDVFNALKNAKEDFEEGAVGSGRGMRCHELKGGIGTSSRIVHLEKDYTLGVLVMTNHAKFEELMIDGKNIRTLREEELKEKIQDSKEREQGSIIIIIATDLPLSSRQLKRLCKRSMAGISRTGANSGNGSGEVALAFSTYNKIPHEKKNFADIKCIMDDKLDDVFTATIDAIHESILSSMLHAEEVVGFRGFKVESLRDILEGVGGFEEYL
ncbi:P1 family peptidase [Lagierella sp.]|uniref:DmpA family aminopeptidase n=1 Tax=Lagierella sp. TaxID=2849657 RepID=UPI002620AC74|nr:P1 family peptidase [Lagierella sp.]